MWLTLRNLSSEKRPKAPRPAYAASALLTSCWEQRQPQFGLRASLFSPPFSKRNVRTGRKIRKNYLPEKINLSPHPRPVKNLTLFSDLPPAPEQVARLGWHKGARPGHQEASDHEEPLWRTDVPVRRQSVSPCGALEKRKRRRTSVESFSY